ncbi:MAG: DUF1826 domain-containing protein [Gammaproteobacteria bacterium]
MIVVPSVNTPNGHHALIGRTANMLADIYQKHVNMVVWERQPNTSLTMECQALLTKKGFTGHLTTLPINKLRHLADALPDLASSPQLKADIQLLVEMFSCLFGLQTIGLRLTPLTGSMCPRFHVDRVPCRLITTYIGTGTEWLPHDSVDRSKLGTGSNGLNDAQRGLYSSPQAIQTLHPGDVALLKGEAWEGNEGAGLVHRSPTIGPGQRRLLLTLDFI